MCQNCHCCDDPKFLVEYECGLCNTQSVSICSGEKFRLTPKANRKGITKVCDCDKYIELIGAFCENCQIKDPEAVEMMRAENFKQFEDEYEEDPQDEFDQAIETIVELVGVDEEKLRKFIEENKTKEIERIEDNNEDGEVEVSENENSVAAE